LCEQSRKHSAPFPTHTRVCAGAKLCDRTGTSRGDPFHRGSAEAAGSSPLVSSHRSPCRQISSLHGRPNKLFSEFSLLSLRRVLHPWCGAYTRPLLLQATLGFKSGGMDNFPPMFRKVCAALTSVSTLGALAGVTFIDYRFRLSVTQNP
jgi:hypothetical protein